MKGNDAQLPDSNQPLDSNERLDSNEQLDSKEQPDDSTHPRGSTESLDSKPEPDPVSEPELSRRELEVIALLARGNPNKIIADTLGISTRTVEVHRYSIMHKLGFRSMSDLVIYAVRKKIIDLDI